MTATNLMGNGAVDTFMVNKTIGIADEKLVNLAEDIPVMTSKQARSHTAFIQDEVEGIIHEYEQRS